MAESQLHGGRVMVVVAEDAAEHAVPKKKARRANLRVMWPRFCLIMDGWWMVLSQALLDQMSLVRQHLSVGLLSNY